MPAGGTPLLGLFMILLEGCPPIPMMPAIPSIFGSVQQVPGFQDVTDRAGLKGQAGRASWGDFNEDGYPDVVFGGSRLFRNNRDGTFTDVTRQTGIGGGHAAVWADFNNDGNLDVCMFGAGNVWIGDGKGKFKLVKYAVGFEEPHAAAVADVNRDGFVDLYIACSNYKADVLVQNSGGRSFAVRWKSPTSYWSRGATAADYNEDGWIDVFVSNYRLDPNQLWVNRGGRLDDRAVPLGAAGDNPDNRKYGWGHTIGSCWADFDNDGHVDLLVGNFSHPPRHQDRVQLLRNLGPPSWKFQDMSAKARIRWQESYATPACADFDNDGRIDFYLTTVYPGDHGVLYRNLGDWRFEDVTRTCGVSTERAYQCAWADFDNDGFLDLLAGGHLFRNRGNGNSWLKVRLRGRDCNGLGIGARVLVEAGGTKFLRVAEAGTGSANQNDPTLHFGLGKTRAKVSLEVVWPCGRRERREVEPCRTILIEEGGASTKGKGPRGRRRIRWR